MTIRRTIIIPAILALSAAGSILAGSATHVAAAPTVSIHVLAASSSMKPNVLFHG
jgi:hypothetical protein